MNFDSQKFFIGLMDFFSILLPGSLLTWLLMGDVGPAVLGEHMAPQSLFANCKSNSKSKPDRREFVETTKNPGTNEGPRGDYQ